MKSHISGYITKLTDQLNTYDWNQLAPLAQVLLDAAKVGRQVFICGNGGSAGNAVHLVNDFIYGIAPSGHRMKAEALSANTAVLTCLGNDIGYDKIFSHQLMVKAEPEDILIVLSGSGNSANILAALEQANQKRMKTFAILGYSGGKAKAIAQHAIHFAVDDMQIAEDLQLVVGHMLMQYLHSELKVQHD